MHGRMTKNLLAGLGAVGLAGWLTGCGTYSLLRPADTLKRGELEMTAGAAFNTLPEMTLVGQAAFGLADWLELGAQYEMYSALGQLRFGLLSSEKHGLALSIAVGGGYATLLEAIDVESRDVRSAGPLAGLTVGRRWDSFELYLGNKTLMLLPDAYFLNAVRAGVRYTIHQAIVLGLEAGVTFHHNFVVLGEGTAHVGFRI